MEQHPRSTTAPDLTPVLVEVDNLDLDPENPRIAGTDPNPTQEQLLKTLWQQFAVDEIALSIAKNGFFQHEPLFAARERGGRLYVIEGNRRLAAVRLLCDSHLRQKVGATDLPTIDASARQRLARLPVIVCSREEIWPYMGFKHVNGPQAWDAISKAEYIAWVHNTLKISLPNIAATIGDKNQTVERLYRARMVLEQAESGKVYDRQDRYKARFSFSHLYTGLGYAGVQEFIGVSDAANADTKEPVKKGKLKELGELLDWMYGSKSKNLPPVIQSQNPDLRLLDEVLQSRDGVVALRRGMPLQVSVDIARGDDRLFREAVQVSKQHLQKAIGTLLTGYRGEPDLLNTAGAIVQLAEKLYEDMHAKDKKGAVPARGGTGRARA